MAALDGADLCLTCWSKHRPDRHHRWIRYRWRHLKRLLRHG